MHSALSVPIRRWSAAKVVWHTDALFADLEDRAVYRADGAGRDGGARRRREFAWEREWRHHGDLHFDWRDLVAVFAPEHRHASFQDLLDERGMAAELLNLLDPRWGLERMIGELASVRPEHVGPLPRY
jgi:hypothetical protein